MPPDIIAGPAPASGPLPLVGKAATGPPPGLNTSRLPLFASLLAQKNLPATKAADLKAPDPPQADPFAILDPAALASLNLKTMDTLPLPALLRSGAAPRTTSELSLPAAAAKADTKDKADAKDKAAASDPGPASAVPALSAPLPVLLVPALLVPALVPLQASSTAAAPSAPGPAIPSPGPAIPPPAGPNALPVQPAASAQTASPMLLPAELPAAAAPVLDTLPRTFTLAAPAALPVSAAFHAAMPLSAASVSPPSASLLSVPENSHLAQAIPETQAIPSTVPASALTLPELAPSFRMPPASVAVSESIPAAQEQLAVMQAPPTLTALPRSVKASGKLADPAGEITLKPGTEFSDTRTVSNFTGSIGAGLPLITAKPAGSEDAPLLPAAALDRTQGAGKPAEPAAVGVLTAAQIPGPDSAVNFPETKPMPAADRAAMVRQVADGVGTLPLPAKTGEAQQISLQLHPKDWGSLHVSVSFVPSQQPGEAKTVTAHIVAETPQVKAALQSQTGALHQALRSSGLHLEHLTVSVKPPVEAVRPAAESASAGFSSRQDAPDARGGQAQKEPAQSGTALSSGFASGGSNDNGRQSPRAPASSGRPDAPEPEEIALPAPRAGRALGRIDTHA